MKIEDKIIKAIEQYQVVGCSNEFDKSNFKQDGGGVEWSDHIPGTIITGVGFVFLGLPTGFNRLGPRCKDREFNLKIKMFTDFEHLNKAWSYDKFNIPCWKHLMENGHTIVRGMMPRVNQTFLHIILENCIERINCVEINKSDLDEMD